MARFQEPDFVACDGIDRWRVRATFFTLHQRDRRCFRVKRLKVIKVAGRVLSLVALAALATPVHGEDDFPLVGTYTENQARKTDGSDPGVSRVKITPRDIDSVFGLCTILSNKREGATFVVHVECKGPGGSQMRPPRPCCRAGNRPSRGSRRCNRRRHAARPSV